MNEPQIIPERRLGRLPAKASRKALMFSDFLRFTKLPTAVRYWEKKKPFQLRTFGNTAWGCCTRASQAHAILRMERLEQRRDVQITDDEVIGRYREMVRRRYNTDDDMGAYMEDALSDWRNPETTIRDVNGKPYPIDAFLRINPFNHSEVKAGLALSGVRGLMVALNLPLAWQSFDPPHAWHVRDAPPIGEWQPGSWGGHAIFARGYDAGGMYLVDTWGQPDRLLTWEAAAIYMDEAFCVVDSVNAWKKKAQPKGITLNLKKVVSAVNDISQIQIKL